MKHWGVIGTGALALASLAGGALALGPTKADMDVCNQKAAEVAKATPAEPRPGGQPATSPSTGIEGYPSKPGASAAPGPAAQPAPAAPGNNPTGGRITDSSPPGIPPSQLGMAPIGETNPVYRQAYLACIKEK